LVAVTATPPPDRLGEFEVEHELGRGGSGVVYAARHGAIEVALKVLREDEVATPKERERFLSEARHLAKLAHPGIVRVLAVGELPDGRPYLAMERLRGATLAERLVMRKFTPEHALVLFEQLAAAVAALHAAGLVHRDIKPENVMLVDAEQRVVLLDLGIARGVDDLPTTTTQAGLQRGTPAYMAPERFFGARATVSSDVYETAVVLYVMMAGDLPWQDPRSPKDRMSPRALSSLGVQVPDELEAAVMAALGPEPVHRPRTIEELVASIRRAGWEGETAAAPPAIAPRKQDRAVVVGVGMSLAFVAAAVVALVVMQRDRSRKSEPSTTTSTTAPVITSLAVAVADAGPVADAVAVAVADAAPAPVAAKKKPQPQPQPQPKAPSTTSSTTTADLPACQNIVALYCNDEFMATEGGMAGALCRNMTKQVAAWAKLPDEARAGQETWCRDSYDTMAAAVAERLRMFRDGLGPP